VDQKYDVAVIGAGLGGLSAATYLARKGLRVILFEKHNIPGGYATSFVRGRYEFEVALHELSGIGLPDQPGALLRYLQYLGVADKVEFVHIPHFYRSVFPDVDLRLPVGRENYTQVLCEAFPREAAGIRRFVGRLFDLDREMRYFYKLSSGKRPPVGELLKAPLNVRNMLRYALATWEQVLGRDVGDHRARAVLSQIWGYFGLPPSQISYLYFATAMASYIGSGATHIKGRSQSLSNAFVQTFEKLGGEMRFNCAVEKISTHQGRVTGVVTEQGDSIEAANVVSNADPITTCREMIGADKVPQKFWRRLGASQVGASSFNVYLGVAAPPQQLGLTDHEVFINTDYDIDRHYQRMKNLVAPGGVAMTCYNSVLPDISPAGTSMLVLTALMYGQPWLHVAPQEYVDVKNRIADSIINLAEKVYPGLRQAAEVVEVATPITNMRYAGQFGGSIYGSDQPPGDTTVFRLPHWGPLGGLYFAGAWTLPGGGYEPAMVSGRLAGDMLLAKTRLQRKGA